MAGSTLLTRGRACGSFGSSPRWRGALLKGQYRFVTEADHPRVGGEHYSRVSTGLLLRRIIPALAGSTEAASHAYDPQPDHPRVGGEHDKPCQLVPLPVGSSPRWRGAPVLLVRLALVLRIIPALAGSTSFPIQIMRECTDHPRVGGEHWNGMWQAVGDFGSSPRWRGARVAFASDVPQNRIIPALAGSTPRARANVPRLADHPRVGGEHFVPDPDHAGMYGSSPRWRGALERYVAGGRGFRIIPALAGSTSGFCVGCTAKPDHPRVGGEHP